MATYDQLKEEITAKVVATLTEKLKGDQHKIASAAPPEDEITGADFKALQKKKSVEEVNEEEEIEERKKRDTPRDSDRREAEKLKMNEEEQLEENHCGGKRHDDLEPGMRCPMCGHVVMAEGEEELDESNDDYLAYLSGYGSKAEMDAAQAASEERERKREEERKAKKARTPGKTLEEDEELEEAQEKEVVEETISNDEWYQNELFESLKKRWTK